MWLRSLRPKADHPLYRAEALVLTLLRAERWADVVSLATTFIDAQDEAPQSLVINRWMAMRELAGSTDAIASEVSA